jgi:two-component system chemotaxis sensor kinase CheA
MSIELTQSHEYFIDESIECLIETQRMLEEFDLTRPRVDLVSQVFRVIHSIKGTASTLGIESITALTHHFENTLDYIKSITTSALDFNNIHVEALQQSLEVISNHFDIYRLGEIPSQEQANQAIATLDSVLVGLKAHSTLDVGSTTSPIAQHEIQKPEFGYQIELFQATEKDVKHVTESLSGIGTLTKVTLHQGAACCFELLTTETPETIGLICAFYISRKDITITLLSDTPSKYRSKSENHARTQEEALKSEAQLNHSVRITVRQLNELKKLVDDLSDLNNHSLLDQDGTIDVTNQKLLDKNIQQLRQLLSRMRNLSLEHLFSKIPTLTHQLAARLGKKVELQITGAELITDKFIIEQLNVPMIQLIRNSIDHGIEMPQVRRHLNKAECGKIELHAKYQYNHLILEIMDDGVGLDRTKVLAAAINKNIPVPEITQDQDVWNLIFAPGLTTSHAITDISGRGFGLDIVKQRIDNLGGSITVESVLGQQTKFIITIPVLTLDESNQTQFKTEIQC